MPLESLISVNGKNSILDVSTTKMRKLAGKCGNWRVISTFKIGIIKKDRKLFEFVVWISGVVISCSNRSNISIFSGVRNRLVNKL